MAIKPTDCIIRIKDLQIGTELSDGIFGKQTIPIYEKHWGNFLKHVRETTNWDTDFWDTDFYAYDKNFIEQLAAYNAVYKRTKKWDDSYIKFKTTGDMMLFILKWS